MSAPTNPRVSEILDYFLPDWPHILYAIPDGGNVAMPVAVKYEDGRVHLLDDIEPGRVRPPKDWPFWSEVERIGRA